MDFEIRYYNANHNKDDIQVVTEFPCFLGHPVWYNFSEHSLSAKNECYLPICVVSFTGNPPQIGIIGNLVASNIYLQTGLKLFMVA